MNPESNRPNSKSGSLSSKKKKKTKNTTVPPVNLEEVFNDLSNVTSSNLNPPPGKILLTPRSAEICLKLGINPEILKIRDIDSFWEAGIDPAVQRIRHEAYVQRRYDIMKQCRLERKRLAIAEFEASTNLNQVDTLTPEMILEQQRQQSSTLIQLEMKRIEKMKLRQQKELEQMIQFEVNRAKVQQDMDKRIHEAKKKEEIRKKQFEKRMRIMAEERRLKELQKAALEEAEEENRMAVARSMHEKEMQLAEEKERKLKEMKKKAVEDEIERKKKNDEHRREVEKFFAEEQMVLRQRLDNMQNAEKKKQDAILEKQRIHAENMRKKRAAIEERIEKNVTMASMIEEKKKNDFLERQAFHEKLREEALEKQEEERRLKAQEVMLQEQRRQMILMQKRKEEEKKAEELLMKFEEEEEHVMQIQEVREKELHIHNERKNVRTLMKLENVERVQRIGEYQRMATLKKIEDTDSRVTTMIEQRRALIAERKKAAIETKLQKEAIAKVMEEVRTNASKANKIISKALTGKVTLESLTSAPSSPGSRSSKKIGKRTSADKLGLGRSSKSAGDSSHLQSHPLDDQQLLYSVTNNQSPPKPYKSPYETDFQPVD